MTDIQRDGLSVQLERAMLVGVILPGSTADPMDPLGELRSLAKTADADVIDEMLANRLKPTPNLYVGTGKAQEIADRAQQNDIDVVIFDNDLSPGQIRELEAVIKRKVLDRSELILDIFACHASTAESRLQIELAQLEYTYPRLRHMWSHLERMAGGSIGTRGPGEKQLETDRRLVQKRVSHLKRQLDEIDDRKMRQVRSRGDVFGACIVGYTNAGKSTLMNLLTGADVYVADKLFATLDTKTRQWNLGDGREVLLSDTVGFVRDLPHHLVASFKATLEEAIWANLLIHVADASSEQVDNQIKAVEGVLDELKCAQDRRMLVLNKIDKLKDPAILSILQRKYPAAIFVSAATGAGADLLLAEVIRRSFGEMVKVTVRAACSNGRLMNFINHHLQTEKQSFEDSTATFVGTISPNRLEELRLFGQDVEIVSPKAPKAKPKKTKPKQ
jgi:GTP-binding protein HflX